MPKIWTVTSGQTVLGAFTSKEKAQDSCEKTWWTGGKLLYICWSAKYTVVKQTVGKQHPTTIAWIQELELSDQAINLENE